MSKNIERRLEHIIEYLLSDEKRHWQEVGKPKQHIYRDIVAVKRWLKTVRTDRWAFENAH